MTKRTRAVFSLLGALAIGGFWRPEFVAFAPFIALAELDHDRRWVRVVARFGVVGFVGSLAIVLRLVNPHL